MSEGRYNIPKQYKVDKGMPLEAFSQRISNKKCREIFSAGVESLLWNYQIVEKDGITGADALIRQRGISIFEIVLKYKISTELLTELFADLLHRPMVLVYLCGDELAMGTYLPNAGGNGGRMVSTDFLSYDPSRMIEIFDFEQDYEKEPEQIHKRIYQQLRHQKKAIMIERAYEEMKKEKRTEVDFAYEFSVENLKKIREDAAYCEARLCV